jgi:hypothetical protein
MCSFDRMKALQVSAIQEDIKVRDVSVGSGENLVTTGIGSSGSGPSPGSGAEGSGMRRAGGSEMDQLTGANSMMGQWLRGIKPCIRDSMPPGIRDNFEMWFKVATIGGGSLLLLGLVGGIVAWRVGVRREAKRVRDVVSGLAAAARRTSSTTNQALPPAGDRRSTARNPRMESSSRTPAEAAKRSPSAVETPHRPGSGAAEALLSGGGPVPSRDSSAAIRPVAATMALGSTPPTTFGGPTTRKSSFEWDFGQPPAIPTPEAPAVRPAQVTPPAVITPVEGFDDDPFDSTPAALPSPQRPLTSTPVFGTNSAPNLDFNLDLGLDDPKLRSGGAATAAPPASAVPATPAAPAAYPAPSAFPAPAAFPAPSAYPAPSAFPAPSAYPAPGAVPAPSAYPAPSADFGPGPTGSPVLESVRIAGGLLMGDEIAVEIRGRDLLARAGSAVRLQLTFIDDKAEVHEVWPAPRPLSELAGAQELERGSRAVLRIPWADISAGLVSAAMASGSGRGRVRLLVSTDTAEEIAVAPIVDQVVLDLRSSTNGPLRPVTARLISPDGTVYGVGVAGGTPESRLVIPELPSGEYRFEMDDGSLLSTDGKPPRQRIQIASRALSSGAAPVTVIQPAVLLVQPNGNDRGANGSAEAPFRTIGAALEYVRRERGRGDRAAADRMRVAEIRVIPVEFLPSHRPLLHRERGESPWEQWWTGRASNTNVPWCLAASTADARRAHAAMLEGAQLENIVIEGLDNLRIVNSTFADLREIAAGSPTDAATVDQDFGQLPWAVLAAPDDDAGRPFRLEIRNCRNVLVEGLFFFGSEAASGVLITNCQAVRLQRCVVAFFSAGALKAGGAFAVGRGIQVEKSGQGSTDATIRIEHCEVGWNTAIRKSVPVRGAGVAAYDSAVSMSRCYIHHNVAALDPVDIVADRTSKLSGDGNNHRDGNRVA